VNGNDVGVGVAPSPINGSANSGYELSGSVYLDVSNGSDDTSMIQTAIGTGGVKLVFRPGEEYIVEKLLLKPNLTLDLNGATLSRDTTGLPGHSGDFTTDDTNGLHLIVNTEAVENVTIRNGFIDDHHSDDGDYYRSAIGFYEDADNILIENVVFLDSHTGIACQDKTKDITNVKVEKCSMTGTFVDVGESEDLSTNSYSILNLAGASVEDIIFNANYAKYTDKLCIFNQNSDNLAPNKRIKITNNSSINAFDSAIYVYGDDVKISNNDILNAGKDGIKVNTLSGDASERCVISNNSVRNAGLLQADGGSLINATGNATVVSGNTIKIDDPATYAASSYYGVNLDSERGIVTGNNIVGFGTSSAKTVYGCVIDSDAPYSKVNDNTFYNLPICVNVGARATYCKVNDNTMQVFSEGIRCHASPETAYTQGFHTFSGNTFVGDDSGDECISLRFVDRISVVGNIFSGTRDDDIQWSNNNAPGSIFGSGNVSDGLAGTNNTIPEGWAYGASPETYSTASTWLVGDSAYKADGTEYRCSTSGTRGTLNSGSTTGSITNGAATLTVNSATGLKTGVFITIAGVTGAKQVTAVDGTTITIDSNADATVTDAAVAYSAPVF
jgi:hypothetical protein